MSGDGYQFGMLHIPQGHLISLEWKVHQRVVVWDL